MTEEKFEKEKFLNEKIKLISDELSEWRKSIKLCNFQLMDSVGVRTYSRDSYVNFELLKEIIIKDLTNKLEEAKSEFEKL